MNTNYHHQISVKFQLNTNVQAVSKILKSVQSQYQ